MTAVEFVPVKREAIPLLIGVAGGTGSGKTFSALLLARGMSGGQPFAFIDTENGRAKHYADLFPEMRHAEIHAPFRPGKYADAIQAGAEKFPVVVVDSMSHEWAGDGGCLDWHDDLMGGDQKKNLASWIEPKKAHKAMVTRLLQVGAHVILAFRAEPKVEQVKGADGRWQIIPKPSITGLDGWLPIAEKMLPYELTASFLLMADAPGVPKPIKLQEQHKPFVPLDRPLTEQVGKALAAWAAGGSKDSGGVASESPGASPGAAGDSPPPAPPEHNPLEDELLPLLERLTVTNGAEVIVAYRGKHTAEEHEAWLQKQIARAREQLDPQPEPEPESDPQFSFADRAREAQERKASRQGAAA